MNTKGKPQRSHRPVAVPALGWQAHAACRPEHAALMTAETKPRPDVLHQLEQVCRSCPVTVDCALYGITTDGVGMFGGLWIPSAGRGRPQELRLLQKVAGL